MIQIESVQSTVNAVLRRRRDTTSTSVVWRICLFLLFLAIIVRLVVAWLPTKTLIVFSVPDDSFYYFTIARHIAQGAGVTFDGLAPTNGFHPLWMVLITPFWWLAGKSEALPISLVLTLGALLDIVTIIGIFQLAAYLTNDRMVAGLALLAYAWNPYNVAASLNGLETSLSAALLVWSLVTYWDLRLQTQPRQWDWLKLGVLWSLLLLARTDYVIILVPCGLDLLWRQRSRLDYAWAGVLAGGIWLPWIIWNVSRFGTISQVSGRAIPYYLHTIWNAEGHTIYEWLVHEARLAYGTLANLAHYSGFGKSLVLLPGSAIGLLRFERRSPAQSQTDATTRGRERLSALLWPSIGALGLLLFHGLVRWIYLPWYFVPSTILLVLWFAIVLGLLARYTSARWSLVITIVFLGFQLYNAFNLVQHGGMWPGRVNDVDVGLPGLMKECEKFGVIGLADSGIAGYYLPCRVVNLDGVVNNQVFKAIQDGRFREYLDKTGIQRAYLTETIRTVVAINEGQVPDAPPFAMRVK